MAPKYKGKKIPRTIIKLGEHKGKKYFSRVIEPVRINLGLPKANPKELESKKGDIIYVKKGSLMAKQYKVIRAALTGKKRNQTMSIPVGNGFPLYKLRRLLVGKKGIIGVKTPLGVTHKF